MRTRLGALPARLLGGAFAGWSAHASRTCNANATLDPDGPPAFFFDTEQTTGTCTASISQSPAFLNADGEAGHGYMRARAEMTRNEGAIDDAEAFARSQFSDIITVSSEGRSGLAFLHVSLFLSGVIDATGTGEAGVRLTAGSSDVVSEMCHFPISSCPASARSIRIHASSAASTTRRSRFLSARRASSRSR